MSSFNVLDHSNAAVAMTLVGSTANGQTYSDLTRSIALPRTLTIQKISGVPGSLGNDKYVATFRDSRQNSTTQKIVTMSVKIEASIPRDSCIDSNALADLMSYPEALFLSTAVADAAFDATAQAANTILLKFPTVA